MAELKIGAFLMSVLGIILGALQIVAMGALLAIGFHLGRKVVEAFSSPNLEL